MLETRVLLLGPLVAGQARVIADAADGKALGFARWVVRPGWWNRVLGPVLFVHEQEDEPLVFTVQRCLLWTQREVRDAEGARVGYVGPHTLRDRNRLLYGQARPEGEGVIYLCVNGVELAVTRRLPSGLELSFAKAIEPDPFAKMLILAAELLKE